MTIIQELETMYAKRVDKKELSKMPSDTTIHKHARNLEKLTEHLKGSKPTIIGQMDWLVQGTYGAPEDIISKMMMMPGRSTEFIGLSAQQSYMFSILVGVRAMDFENYHKNELYDYVWKTVNDKQGFKKTLAEHKKDKENVFVPDYDEVQNIVNNYIKEGDDLDFKIILKIYATYPFRLEVAELKFLKTLHEYKKEMNKDVKGNYIVKKSRPRNSFMFSFNNYKTFEKYGERKINVNDKVLTKLLLDKISTDQPWSDNNLSRNSMSKKITAFFEKNGLSGVHPTNLSKMVIKKEYEKMGKELRDTQIRLASERGHSVNTQLEIYLTD